MPPAKKTTAKEPAEKPEEARKAWLLANKRPAQLAKEDLALFSDKELAAWQKEIDKQAAKAAETQRIAQANQTQHARLMRLRKLVNRDPAVRDLFNAHQAAKARIAELEAELAKGKGA